MPGPTARTSSKTPKHAGHAGFGSLRWWGDTSIRPSQTRGNRKHCEGYAEHRQQSANVSGNLWNFADVINQFCGFRILLSERREWVGIVKDASSHVEFLEMLFWPSPVWLAPAVYSRAASAWGDGQKNTQTVRMQRRWSVMQPSKRVIEPAKVTASNVTHTALVM